MDNVHNRETIRVRQREKQSDIQRNQSLVRRQHKMMMTILPYRQGSMINVEETMPEPEMPPADWVEGKKES